MIFSVHERWLPDSRGGCEAVENEQSDKREKREPYTFEGWSF